MIDEMCYVIPAPYNTRGVCTIPSEIPGADYSTTWESDPPFLHLFALNKVELKIK